MLLLTLYLDFKALEHFCNFWLIYEVIEGPDNIVNPHILSRRTVLVSKTLLQ